MDTREWIFVLGVIVVVVVALFAAAKWRRQRFEDIGSRDYRDRDEAEDFGGSDELPAGGARTVGYRDPNDIEKMNNEIRARAEASKPRLSSFRPEPVEQQALLLDAETEDDFDDETDEEREGVPLLLDPSDEHNREFDESEEGFENRREGQDEPLPNEDEVSQLQALADELDEGRKEPTIGVGSPETRSDSKDSNSKAKSKPESEDQPKQESKKQEAQKQGQKPAEKKESKSSESQGDIGEIIIINLMTSPSTPYEGSALFKVLNELGMRHGDMDIFHYCGRHGDEEPQFRMANLLKPGYFELAEMDDIRTHALCFFYELLPGQDNMKVYESMLSVINRVRDELGGEMHDENRSVFTIQTSEHCRNRIRDFQRRHLLDR